MATLKTAIQVLAMVIRNVMTIASTKMTIAATQKTVLSRTENSGEKGTEHPCFVKYCYFYSPRDAPKRLRKPLKPSWLAEKIWKLRLEKRALRLYIYTLTPRVLYKYTIACKGFFILWL